ncbi:MAG: hypothetical protein G3I09_00200 [Ferrovum sp.]|nr:hypothetical protein [Ferrovum sp.]
MLNLRRQARQFHRQSRSLTEILPWLLQLTPGVVLNKDGGLLACFSLRGLFVDSCDPQEVDRASADLEAGLRGLDPRFTLWSTVLRRPVMSPAPSCFPHPGSSAIDRLYCASMARLPHFLNRHYLTLLYTPGDQESSRLKSWLQGLRPAGLGYETSLHRDQVRLQRRLARFEEMLTQFCQAVPALGLCRLENESLLLFLQEMSSPTSPSRDRLAQPCEGYLDGFLGEERIVIAADHVRCEGPAGIRYGAALSLKAWPSDTYPGMLDALLQVPVALTLSQVLRLVDSDQARRYIKNVQRFHLNLQKSLFSYVREAISGEESVVRDTGRAVSAATARQALTDMTAEKRLYGYVNVTILVWTDKLDDLDQSVAEVSRVVRAEGYLLLRERLHLNSAWSGSLPGQWGELVRWHFVSTANWADLCAFRTFPSGRRENLYLSQQRGIPSPGLTVFRTRDGGLYRFNLHDHDLAHTFVVGPSRSGKSVWVNFVLSQFQKYAPANTIIFDKDRSCRIPTVLQGGQCFDPGSRSMKINPFVGVVHESERTWLSGWVELLLGARGHHLSAQEFQWVCHALEGMASLSPSLHRLQSLVGLLPANLVEELAPWLDGGIWGGYFDHAEDDLHWSSLTCFEMGDILRQPPLARAFLEWAFHRIETLLEARTGSPTLIYIEESWFMLADPVFSRRIREWLKTLPKKLGSVIMATQSLDDLSGSDIFSTIADNVPTRIFLPNPQAFVHRDLYRKQFGLLDSQTEVLARAQRKSQYLLHTPYECVLLEAHFDGDVLAWLRSDAHALQLFDGLVQSRNGQLYGQEAYFMALAQETKGGTPSEMMIDGRGGV